MPQDFNQPQKNISLSQVMFVLSSRPVLHMCSQALRLPPARKDMGPKSREYLGGTWNPLGELESKWGLLG